MKKLLSSIVTFASIFFSLNVFAFSPATVSNSLVKITILDNGSPKFTASGFVYKDNKSIITSLHVMKNGPNIRIKIEFGNQSCIGRIKKVFQKADLVLLEAYNLDGSPTLPPWTPISSINSNPLSFGEDIFSVGYNSGSRSWISRKLSKGSGASEKLNDLIPAKDVAQIKNLGMPHLDLKVIYIDGSLLPGFSGAPLLNDQGQLIGIADGGLENGASNVSWGIPSSEISNLISSTITTLPASIGSASVVYSAEVDAPLTTTIIKFNEFQFVHTKTRTLQQLIDRSDDRETLLHWLEAFMEIKVNYSNISFDIYEDIVNGFIITVPHGKSLATEHDMLSVQLSNRSEENYNLYYSPASILGQYDGEITQEVMEESHQQVRKYFTDFYKSSPDYMVVEDIDEYKIKKLSNGYLATTAFSIEPRTSTEENREYATYIYCKLIYTDESTLVCYAYLNNFNNENLLQVGTCMHQNADCDQRGSNCDYGCQLAHDWIQIMASVNLTTVADNK